jgi:hypothetical protein
MLSFLKMFRGGDDEYMNHFAWRKGIFNILQNEQWNVAATVTTQQSKAQNLKLHVRFASRV